MRSEFSVMDHEIKTVISGPEHVIERPDHHGPEFTHDLYEESWASGAAHASEVCLEGGAYSGIIHEHFIGIMERDEWDGV
jgi:hypothetical protein